jgi:peroxiredoxin
MRNGPLVVFVVLLFFGCQRRAERETDLPIGSVAPDFRLETVDHTRFYLNQQRDRVVVLVFWITTCQVCKREMVELAKLHDDLASQQLQIAAICGDPENLDAVHQIVGGLGIQYPVLLDHGGEVGKRYHAGTFPTTVVVDQEGRIALRCEEWAAEVRTRVQARIQALLEKGGTGT